MIDINMIAIIRPNLSSVVHLDATFACGNFVAPCSVEACDSDSTGQLKISLASKRNLLPMAEIQTYSATVLWIARIGAGLWKFQINVYKLSIIS